jgi:hypothetical protein
LAAAAAAKPIVLQLLLHLRVKLLFAFAAHESARNRILVAAHSTDANP